MTTFARALFALAALRALDTVHPRPRPVHLASTVHLDGREIAKSVATHARDHRDR